jgi:hypothetical protein
MPNRSKAGTTAALVKRRLDTVDLIIQGATLRQVGELHHLAIEAVRFDYFAGLEMVTDRSIKATIALRDEVTMRQRLLIMANMKRALDGDKGAATIIQRADELLVSIWGLRAIKPDFELPSDPMLTEALEAYLVGVAEQIAKATPDTTSS